MKRDGMYRYCIQFNAQTEAEIRVGELLEKLGRKKSAVIITALLEYMDNHPELESGDHRHLKVSTISISSLEEHISRIIEERLSGIDLTSVSSAGPAAQAKEVSQDIVDMLGDLDLFTI